MAAALAVLDLPELLENIFLHLEDWQEPFGLQRVNKRFKATIERSIHLRRKMWLAPKLSSKDIDLTEDTSVTYWRPDPLREILYNPLLMRDAPGKGYMRWPNIDKCRFFVLPLSMPRSISMHNYHGRLVDDDLILRQGSSWRRTLWTQTSAVPVQLVFNSFPKVSMCSEHVEVGPCTTMGDLIDSGQHHLDEVQKKVRERRVVTKKVPK
nr:hypothetical protein B0A51_14199 [Rachicladosporium sp. CCFEE 5018]